MADTARNIAALKAILVDNTSGDITPQDIRDFLVSCVNIVETALQTMAGPLTVTGTATATLFSGSGASLTSLNGSNISSGTVADARLSSNVPLKNASSNALTGALNVTGIVQAGTFQGAASGLTSVPAAQLTGSHGLPDGVLSANVPLKNVDNTFSGNINVGDDGVVLVPDGSASFANGGLSISASGDINFAASIYTPILKSGGSDYTQDGDIQLFDASGDLNIHLQGSDGSASFGSGAATIVADGSASFASGYHQLNSDGSVWLDEGSFTIAPGAGTSIGSGNIQLNVDGTASFANGSCTIDSSGAINPYSINVNTNINTTGITDTWGITTTGSLGVGGGAATIGADGSASFASGALNIGTDGSLNSGAQVAVSTFIVGMSNLTVDNSGNLVAASVAATSGIVMFSGLPTSDPVNPGQLWNNGGVVNVSSGGG
jgi:hypothetical protein